MNMKAIINSSMYSIMVYPKTQDIMATMFWAHGEKIIAIYGEEYLGMCFSSLMKVWNNWANFSELSLGYWSNRSTIERRVRFGPSWSYNISFMDSTVMVKRTFWS